MVKPGDRVTYNGPLAARRNWTGTIDSSHQNYGHRFCRVTWDQGGFSYTPNDSLKSAVSVPESVPKRESVSANADLSTGEPLTLWGLT